jgi:hypothetical protein
MILHELGGVPNLGSDELNDARDTAVTLELTNRFANVRGESAVPTSRVHRSYVYPVDPRADEKTLWVQAKRAVLAILRVQPAKDLVEALMMPVTKEHETIWEEIIENEMMQDHKQRSRRMPSQANAEYRLEDIRELVDLFVASINHSSRIVDNPSGKSRLMPSSTCSNSKSWVVSRGTTGTRASSTLSQVTSVASTASACSGSKSATAWLRPLRRSASARRATRSRSGATTTTSRVR